MFALVRIFHHESHLIAQEIPNRPEAHSEGELQPPVLADLAARNLVTSSELPIGVVTAFLGAPFFVLVLRTSRREVW